MIKTASDFEAAVKELTTARDSLSDTYESTMSSETHNKIFENIENELNAIYEQLRVLEDIKDYCKTSVMQSIEEEKTKLMDKLRIIEHASDSFSDTSCVAFEVGLNTAPSMKIRDRNGDTLPVMRSIEGQLEIDGTDSRRATISSVKCTTTEQCYSNTARNLASGKAARSMYVLTEPVNGGVAETYEVTFKEPVLCNYLDIKTVNCETRDVIATVKDSKGVAETKNLEAADGYIDMEAGKLSSLKFTINASNYDYRDVVIDRQKGNSSFAFLNDDYYKRKNATKTIEAFVADTDKKNAQRYVNEFVADAEKAGKSKLWQTSPIR